MLNKEDNETKEEENKIIENVKEIITEKKDNGGETMEEKIIDIKEEIEEKEKTEIPQIIESNEIFDKLRNGNLKESEKDVKQKGPCQKCKCIIF